MFNYDKSSPATPEGICLTSQYRFTFNINYFRTQPFLLALPNSIDIKILILQKSNCLTAISGVTGDSESIYFCNAFLLDLYIDYDNMFTINVD